MPAKFNINDNVSSFAFGNGKVIGIEDKLSADGKTLYKIQTADGEIRLVTESLIDDNGNEFSESLTDNTLEWKISKIKEKISSIFEQLNINPNESQETKFQDAYKLFKYIVYNSTYDQHIMEEKGHEKSDIQNMEISDIYRCLCENRSVCTSDAASLSLLYRMIGIDSKHITIGDKGSTPKGIHEVVLCKFNDKDLICDPTLTRNAIKEGNIQDTNPKIFLFSPNDFFSVIYPEKEIKFQHDPINLSEVANNTHHL